MSQAIAVIICLFALWTYASAQEGDYAPTLPKSPEMQDVFGGQWYGKHYCAHLVRSGEGPLEGMTATVDDAGDPTCTGEPTDAAKAQAVQFFLETQAMIQWRTKGRAEMSDMQRQNPDIAAETVKAYPDMDKASRDQVKADVTKK